MRSPRNAALLAGLTLVYVAAGRFGLTLAFVNESATAVWPPTGIAIAACLLLGPHVWPALFAGAFIVNLTTSQAMLPSILIAGGNTAEAVLAAWLVQRFAGGPAFLEKTRRIVTYAGAAIASAAVAASAGLAALIAGGLVEPQTGRMVWLTWWTGDLSSAILITPPIVAWTRRRPGGWTSYAVLEALLGLAAVLAATYWVFGPTVAGTRGYPIMFVILPMLLWGALRFGPPGAATTVLATAAVATWGTLHGYGPFSGVTPDESLLLLQAYLGIKGIVMLTLASEVVARRTAERDLRQLNLDLEHRIAARAEELQRLHGRLAEAQRVAHIGSWEWDVATNSLWWSDEMFRVYGLPEGSPISYEAFMALVHPEDRARVGEVVSASAQTGQPFLFEHRAIKPDGTVVVLHARGTVVMDAAGRPLRMMGIGHDITERRRAEEERIELVREQAARREAEESNRMKDHFLATLSHELRTPLNAIIGWAQLLRSASPDDGLRERALDAIHRNVTIQAQLVSDILDVARIRSGAISIDARPTPVASIVEGALDIVEAVISEKRISVVRDLADGLAVMGDARRLQQVCWNLLSNAAKFVEPGGWIAVTARRDDGSVVLTIEDNGSGIPEEFLPYVFEQFRQADPSLTRRHGGLGLGLAISQDLVRLHGGTITVANRREGGAIFTVRLPAAPPAGAEGDVSGVEARGARPSPTAATE